MKTTINFAAVRATEDYVIPSKREEDAGFDIYPSFTDVSRIIQRGETVLLPTNIASSFDSGYYFQLEDRSSMAVKGLKISGGVIDSGYRGEWFVCLTNHSDCDVIITKESNSETWATDGRGKNRTLVLPYVKAIAQAVLHDVPETEVKQIPYEELKEIPSKRSINGFGSTDSKTTVPYPIPN